MTEFNYAKLDYAWMRHHARLRDRLIVRKIRPLPCQECGGCGGGEELARSGDFSLSAPCGFCEGLGVTTPHGRAFWLRWKKELKKESGGGR